MRETVSREEQIELVPDREHLLPGVPKEIMERNEHEWCRGGISAEEREEVMSY